MILVQLVPFLKQMDFEFCIAFIWLATYVWYCKFFGGIQIYSCKSAVDSFCHLLELYNGCKFFITRTYTYRPFTEQNTIWKDREKYCACLSRKRPLNSKYEGKCRKTNV